jgi:hypothetical protein
VAKAQSFEAKTKKKADQLEFKVIKVVYSYQPEENGPWKYAEKVLKVPFDSNEEQFIKEEIKKLTSN